MSKKKETEIIKNPILEKAKELGFEIIKDQVNEKDNHCIYALPFGRNTELVLFLDEPFIWIRIISYIPIRKIESPEDLEILFNAICPEKYRLPFG